MTVVGAIAQWTFVSQTAIPADVHELLVGNERPIAAFKTFRDSAVFTTKRLIVRDAQGVTGKKVEIYSLPYANINMWSSENAGTLDFNAELELWTRSGHITVKLGRGVDIRALDRLLAQVVLGEMGEGVAVPQVVQPAAQPSAAAIAQPAERTDAAATSMAAAGWYDDGSGRQRYWDGASWGAYAPGA